MPGRGHVPASLESIFADQQVLYGVSGVLPLGVWLWIPGSRFRRAPE
jgi:hypothetical protein